jgi:hypothetical protein
MEYGYFTRGEQEYLLKVARQTLESWVYRRDLFEPQTVNQKMWGDHPVTVTLYLGDDVLGRSTTGDARETLLLSVRDHAFKAIKQADAYGIEANTLPDMRFEIIILVPIGRGKEQAVVFTDH